MTVEDSTIELRPWFHQIKNACGDPCGQDVPATLTARQNPRLSFAFVLS